jgi:hypothetical protein
VIEQSTVAMTRCNAEGNALPFTAPTPGISITGSRVWFSEGVSLGGTPPSGLPFPTPPSPGITLDRSDLFVAGDGSTTIAAGSSPTLTPVAAVVGNTSNTTVDPDVTLRSHGGAPDHTGNGTFTRSRVPSLLAMASATRFDLRLHATTASFGFLLLSTVPARPTQLGPIGDLWLDGSTLFVLDSGPVPPNGDRIASFTLPRLPLGLPVMVQGLALYPIDVKLSAPAPVTFGR